MTLFPPRSNGPLPFYVYLITGSGHSVLSYSCNENRYWRRVLSIQTTRTTVLLIVLCTSTVVVLSIYLVPGTCFIGKS